MSEQRTAWNDVQDLAAQIGHEVRFEPAVIPQPDLVCEPVTEYEWDAEGTARTYCSVHMDEGWPCRAFREGRGVTPQPPLRTNRLVVRPKDDGEGQR